MRILILGGDGYLGWNTAMYLSKHGHEILVVDNYLRRNLSTEENVQPLFDVPNLHKRVDIWQSLSGCKVKLAIGDLKDWSFVAEIFQDFMPEAIVHYAEQPSAPYSMLNRKAATLTISNNLLVTSNLIHAVKEFTPDAHVVKLGTMGEYGTPNIDIEEGWLNVQHNGRKDKFLYPRQAGSLYHTTKIMDTDLLWFYVRMWDLRATDLMQGPVYGVEIDEMQGHEDLYPIFNYDEIFGTVLNRFIVQAASNYPLTVYGAGNQTRGYLNVKDTMKCILIALENPAAKGELRIYNQFTELFSVNDLATKVQKVGNDLGLNVVVKNVTNNRIEKEEHYYNPKKEKLQDLGLQPCYLTDDNLAKMVLEIVVRHKDRIVEDQIQRNIKWDQTKTTSVKATTTKVEAQDMAEA